MSGRVILGDCIDVMSGMEAESVDCVLTDPPYGMAFRSSWRIERHRFDAIANDGEFDPEWQAAWMAEAYRLLKPDSHFYTFCSDHHIGRFRDVAASVGFTVKRSLVWWKRGGGMGDLEADWAHETEFLVFAHKGRRKLEGSRQGNVLDFGKVPAAQLQHPTQKPLTVLRPLILASTRPGEVVLDPFAGSGSTGVVCREEGREYILIEQDPKYVDVANARLAQGGLFEVAA